MEPALRLDGERPARRVRDAVARGRGEDALESAAKPTSASASKHQLIEPPHRELRRAEAEDGVASEVLQALACVSAFRRGEESRASCGR